MIYFKKVYIMVKFFDVKNVYVLENDCVCYIYRNVFMFVGNWIM